MGLSFMNQQRKPFRENGPDLRKKVNGIGECDRDMFNGDEVRFREFLTANTKSA